MALSSSPFLITILMIVIGHGDRSSVTLAASSAAKTFGLNLHHRFSDPVKKWARAHHSSHHLEKGSAEYYSALAARDLALRRDRIAGEESPAVTFSGGNLTERITSLGFLHYAMVSLGTPTLTFMVALDTGSDLFWLPCSDGPPGAGCHPSTTAPPDPHSSSSGFERVIYNPSMSLTSERVACSSLFCDLQSECSETSSHCPYKISYVSADTTSSGTLIEDVLYLTTEDTRPVIVEARIIFGCGQVQTGSFLDVAAPNGLLGLGMENISVPSILSSVGLSSGSFSMCFRHDGKGRISFGDQGNLDQEETSFNINQMHPTYNISITGIVVGTISTDVEFSALVDSGTSFTYLTDPAYTSLSENVQDNRHEPDARIPFEYCYDISSKDSTIQTPDVNLTTKGGSQFPVSDPIIVITVQEDKYVYCLAVVKSNKLNIIGQNFMTGLRIVFDRERLVLGWKSSNCYDAEGSSILPSSPWNLSATSADGANNYTPESTRGTGNHTYVAVLTPPFSCSSDLKYINSSTMTFCFLLFSLIFCVLHC